MNRTITLNRNLINFGLPLGLLAVLIFLMKSSFIEGNDTLSLAVTADLLLTVPLVYFLLIRKTRIPKTTVVPMMVLGLLIGSYFLPKESQTYLELFKSWALPVIEISVLTFVIIKVRKTIITYKKLKGATPDFYDTLKNVCSEIVPAKSVALLVATEVAVIYYGFIDWKRKEIGSNEFTYHKDSGTPALLGGFIMVIGVEAIAVHFLLAKWSLALAWVLTALSLYTAIQVLGFARSLSKRPISIGTGALLLRYGIMNETRISYSDIETVELSKKELEKDELTRTLSPLGENESHNVIIRLKRENTLTGIYGFRKEYKVLGLHVDKPGDFQEKLENVIRQSV
ncbi:hypothetical protein FUAX_45440 (plasmid) [Fulvitalea axinellae]|uniref:PH domain-containing protein n=1 Tax=Fulvitalea axinellae TaxID=1182444 RepID=A0AAU9D3H0_9BACT|nr:hypothetical protein FUAX_45440 [Fulvitalea axinellae]